MGKHKESGVSSAPNLSPMPYRTLLAAHRQTHALTQKEVGDLVGRSADSIASYEAGTGTPSLLVGLRLQFLYGKSLSDLLPEFFVKAVEDTIPAIQRLSIAIEGRTDVLAQHKATFIKSLGDRLARILPDA